MQKGPKHSLKQYGWFHFLYEGGDTQMKQKWHASAVGLCLDSGENKGSLSDGMGNSRWRLGFGLSKWKVGVTHKWCFVRNCAMYVDVHFSSRSFNFLHSTQMGLLGQMVIPCLILWGTAILFPIVSSLHNLLIFLHLHQDLLLLWGGGVRGGGLLSLFCGSSYRCEVVHLFTYFF